MVDRRTPASQIFEKISTVQSIHGVFAPGLFSSFDKDDDGKPQVFSLTKAADGLVQFIASGKSLFGSGESVTYQCSITPEFEVNIELNGNKIEGEQLNKIKEHIMQSLIAKSKPIDNMRDRSGENAEHQAIKWNELLS